MKHLVVIFVFCFYLISCQNTATDSNETPAPESTKTGLSGEQMFKINCNQCHLPAEDFTAPALANVALRWQKKADLYAFIKDPQAVIVRNKYAKSLFEKWKHAPMPAFPNLTNDDIDAILEYCNTY